MNKDIKINRDGINRTYSLSPLLSLVCCLLGSSLT